jgi:hypothetical protein
LLRLLADPQRTVAHLNKQGLLGPFFELVQLEFGLDPPTSGQEAIWAERFTASLCLVELYESTHQPADFPFLETLPAPMYRPRQRNFLQTWQHHELFKGAFRQRAKAIDSQYPLGIWVANLSSTPTGSTFLNVEKALWEETQRELEAIDSKASAVEFVQQYQNIFRRRAEGFWAREGEVSGWRVLARMVETVLGAAGALDTITQYTTPAAMVEQYTSRWWQVDRDYRYFRTELDHSAGHLDAALKWTSRLYHDYLEGVNSHFGKWVSDQNTWPPKNHQLGGAALWNSSARETGGLQAVMLVDALRYELAQDLAGRLDLAPHQLGIWFSPVPSVTEVGMAALLPGWPEFQVDYARGGWQITGPGTTDNLARKDKRLSWLVKHLGSAAVFDLDQWLTTSLDQLQPDLNWIVVTSSVIDTIGEGVGTVALHTFDSLLNRLEQGVRRLLAAGCTNVHIVTDHGFLLREAVRETDKVQVEAEGVLKKAERYLIGRDLPPTDLPHLPVSGSGNLVAWFPPGIGCFVTTGPYNYMHGGIALQEIVIPYIHLRQTLLERPVGVALHLVDGPEIRNAIFKVRLTPERVDLLSKARQVELDITRGTERVSQVWEAQLDRDIVEKSLMLEPDYGLAPGDQIRVRVRDKTTKELLAEQAAVIQVELEL